MLYMPYSTLFVQENASKDKNVPSSQDFTISEICAISKIFGKVLVRFRHQRSLEAEGQTSLLAYISPLAKYLAKFQ